MKTPQTASGSARRSTRARRSRASGGQRPVSPLDSRAWVAAAAKPAHPKVDYVEGLENPTEGSRNIIRWLVAHDYSDEDIAKVMGGNAIRLLSAAWS